MATTKNDLVSNIAIRVLCTAVAVALTVFIVEEGAGPSLGNGGEVGAHRVSSTDGVVALVAVEHNRVGNVAIGVISTALAITTVQKGIVVRVTTPGVGNNNLCEGAGTLCRAGRAEIAVRDARMAAEDSLSLSIAIRVISTTVALS